MAPVKLSIRAYSKTWIQGGDFFRKGQDKTKSKEMHKNIQKLGKNDYRAH